jgi:hypothetical protein
LHTIQSDEDIKNGKELIKLFMNQYVSLYGEEHQTYTFHAVVNHLADDAALHGSLSQHSMFSLESTLGIFKNYIKGNKGVPSQFINGKNQKQFTIK